MFNLHEDVRNNFTKIQFNAKSLTAIFVSGAVGEKS